MADTEMSFGTKCVSTLEIILRIFIIWEFPRSLLICARLKLCSHHVPILSSYKPCSVLLATVGDIFRNLKTKLYVHLSLKKRVQIQDLQSFQSSPVNQEDEPGVFTLQGHRLLFPRVMWACFLIYLQMLNCRLSVSLT